MRNVIIAIVLAACGASESEVRTAKLAQYNADPHQILQIAIDTARQEYKLGDVNEQNLSFITAPKFYSSEGDLESPGAGGYINMRAGSVEVMFIVTVVPTADHRVAVTVVPRTFQKIGFSPKPRELQPDDPYLPPFVLGRADALALAIYQHAKGYVAAPPGAS
ncbi:MAG TPA: hypothetical protein VGF94_24045 [Kofleriaceae bacterium]|jgi:hypothetical protein